MTYYFVRYNQVYDIESYEHDLVMHDYNGVKYVDFIYHVERYRAFKTVKEAWQHLIDENLKQRKKLSEELKELKRNQKEKNYKI